MITHEPDIAEYAGRLITFRDGQKISDEVKNAIIEEYLSGVLSRRSVPFVTGGSVVAATRRTPKNLKEAGALAKNYFDNKED